MIGMRSDMLHTLIFAVIAGMVTSYIFYKVDEKDGGSDPELCGGMGMITGIGLGIVQGVAGWGAIFCLIGVIVICGLMAAPPIILDLIKERKQKEK